MNKSSKEWEDFSGRFQHSRCPLCGNQTLMFSEPNFGEMAGLRIIAVTCSSCAHVEILNAEEVNRLAKKIDEDLHTKGWR